LNAGLDKIVENDGAGHWHRLLAELDGEHRDSCRSLDGGRGKESTGYIPLSQSQDETNRCSNDSCLMHIDIFSKHYR